MKVLVVFAVIFVIGQCHGQTHPLAYGRSERSRSNTQENTDHLTSSSETRIIRDIRSETGALRQLILRLEQSNIRVENAMNLLKNDVGNLKTEMGNIRDEINQDNDLSVQQKPSSKSNDLNQKLDNLNLLVSAVSHTVSKLERDVSVVRKGMRNNHNNLHHNHHPQFALMPSRDDSSVDNQGACTINDPNTESGIRKLRKNFFAFCEMETEDAGGWIVIQNRFDGSTDFFRTWIEYKEGFGNVAGEFFMGLDKIHELTSSRLHELMIVMEDFGGEKKFAKYSAFGISDESSAYTLNLLGKYSGDAGDSLTYHAGMKFSTMDNDNDGWLDGNCARSHFGAFWYNSCDETNLNGRYFAEGKFADSNDYHGIYWSTFKGSMNSFKSVKMMIRPAEV